MRSININSDLGEGGVVEVSLAQPGLKFTLVGTAGGTDPDTGEAKKVKLGRRAWTATVFHVSQTDRIQS